MLIKHLNNQLKEQDNQEDMALLDVILASEELNPNFHMENETYIIKKSYIFLLFTSLTNAFVHDCLVYDPNYVAQGSY